MRALSVAESEVPSGILPLLISDLMLESLLTTDARVVNSLECWWHELQALLKKAAP